MCTSWSSVRIKRIFGCFVLLLPRDMSPGSRVAVTVVRSSTGSDRRKRLSSHWYSLCETIVL